MNKWALLLLLNDLNEASLYLGQVFAHQGYKLSEVLGHSEVHQIKSKSQEPVQVPSTFINALLSLVIRIDQAFFHYLRQAIEGVLGLQILEEDSVITCKEEQELGQVILEGAVQ